jgi:molybdopterin biosynthesis enzyme MoaB
VVRTERCEDEDVDPIPLAAVVTVSDGVTQGTRKDASGDVASEILGDHGYQVATRVAVPDERPDI